MTFSKRFPMSSFSLVFVLVSALAHGQDRMTLDWIYGPESREVTALPRYTWLSDGDALILDVRQPAGERTIQRLDPETGQLSEAVDPDRALASLRTLMGRRPTSLPWPEAFGPEGRIGLYEFQGDLFVLKLDQSEFVRLTETNAREIVARLSPDGQRVAFVRENDLYCIEISSGRETRLTDDGSATILNGTVSWVYWEEIFGRQDIGYWWSPDSTSIAYLQTDESPVTQVSFVDFQPAEPRVITQRYPKAGTDNPIVKLGLIPVSQDDSERSETRWVEVPQNYEYLVRVQWLPDSRSLTLQTMNRAQDELILWRADRRTPKASKILTETDPAWINIHDDLTFLDNGQEFLWSSERSGYAHLYRVGLDGTFLNQVTSGDWATHATGSVFWRRKSIAAVDEGAGLVYFSGLKDGSTQKQLYRAPIRGGADGPGTVERISQEDGSHITSFRFDAGYYFDQFSSIDIPPSLTLRRNDGSLVLTLAESNSDPLARFDIQYPEQFTISARDGFAMPAELLKPRDFDPGKAYPLILYVYGGPSAPTVQDRWRSDLYFDQMLLDRGYLVARVDNRASTAISHELETTILNQMLGPVERRDVLDGIAWLKDRPFVDPDRVGVWGWSGGGTFTLNLMTHSQEFAAGIAVAAVTQWHYYDTKWAEFVMKRPEDNPRGYQTTDLVATAQDLHGRLLLVHGTYDDNVHPQNAWAFVDALVRANKTFDMMFYPMRKHGIADIPARIHLYTTMLEFWDRTLE